MKTKILFTYLLVPMLFAVGVSGLALNDLEDVTISVPQLNDHLMYNGTNWYNSVFVGGGVVGVSNWTRNNADGGTVYTTVNGDKVLVNDTITATGDITAPNLNIANWDTAFGWGDHNGIYSLLLHGHDFVPSVYANATFAKMLWVNNTFANIVHGHDNYFNQDLNTTNNATFVNITGTHFGDGGNLTNITLDSTTYVGSSIELIEGTLDSGNVRSTWIAKDNNEYNISEELNKDFVVYINFTGVTDFNNIILRWWYIGGKGHEIHVGLYDFVSSSYEEEYGSITDMADFAYSVFNVFDPADHINGGDVYLRLRHDSEGDKGRPTHDLRIDYCSLLDGLTPLTNIDHDSLTNRDNKTNHPWAMPTDGSRNFTDNVTGQNFTGFDFIGNSSVVDNLTVKEIWSGLNNKLFINTSDGFGNANDIILHSARDINLFSEDDVFIEPIDNFVVNNANNIIFNCRSDIEALFTGSYAFDNTNMIGFFKISWDGVGTRYKLRTTVEGIEIESKTDMLLKSLDGDIILTPESGNIDCSNNNLTNVKTLYGNNDLYLESDGDIITNNTLMLTNPNTLLGIVLNSYIFEPTAFPGFGIDFNTGNFTYGAGVGFWGNNKRLGQVSLISGRYEGKGISTTTNKGSSPAVELKTTLNNFYDYMVFAPSLAPKLGLSFNYTTGNNYHSAFICFDGIRGYFEGLRIEMIHATDAGRVTIEDDLIVKGSISAGDGWTGSWVNNEGDTVTVVDGIITDVS